jgi:hypothetical protein
MYIESAGTPPPPDTMFVYSIAVTRIPENGGRYRGQATVVIHKRGDQPVFGATVSGHFSGPTSETVSGTTEADGSVVVTSEKVKSPSGVWCFTVDDVSLGADIYDPSRNVETSDCEGGAAPAVVAASSQPQRTPRSFELAQNYPNPFNPRTEISFSVPEAGNVSLVVYDVKGRKVAVLTDRHHEPGTYTYSWDAGSLASGVYFYRIQAGQFVKIRKMILMK